MHRTLVILAALSSLMLAAACARNTARRVSTAALDVTSASPPDAVTTTEPKQVDPARDVVNVEARGTLELGMVMEIHVTRAGAELAHIGMMQVRKSPRGADIRPAIRSPGEKPQRRADGDWVIVEAYGKGALVSRTAVSDPSLIAAEGGGLVSPTERDVYASLPAPKRIDTLQITETASGESQRIDISKVMDQFCTTTPTERACRAAQ